jgi:glycosyltransferase involved in cell wall biosynthesis
MKIAIDGYELGREARGVGRVIDNILMPLFDLLPGSEFRIYTKESIGKYAHPRAGEHVLAYCGGYLRWQNGPLRRALRRSAPDLLVATNYVLPLVNPWKSVLFEHDISVIAHPEWYPRRYAYTRKSLVKRSLKKATSIVVPSGFTREEMLASFGVEPGKLRVICYGVEAKFRRAGPDKVLAWKEKKGLTGKKIVGFLGSIFVRRHIPCLVRAVSLVRREVPETVLYVVGKDLSGSRPGEMARLLGQEWIRWDETLSEEELPLFYSALDAFAYLSEYEGFGFPPLEALACGAPVVLLRGSSLEEFFGDFALMVEHPDDQEVRAALQTLLSDSGARRRQAARFEEARSRFTWQKTAGEVAQVLRDLGAK